LVSIYRLVQKENKRNYEIEDNWQNWQQKRSKNKHKSTSSRVA